MSNINDSYNEIAGESINEIMNDGVEINPKVYQAYINQKKTKNTYVDLDDLVCEDDISIIIKELRAINIDTLTISSKGPGLIDVLARFVSQDCKITGLTRVNGVGGELSNAIIISM